MSPLQPGRIVAEHLKLVRLLGRGAMGSVWLADHLKLQAQVAVKFMAPAMADDPASVHRFRLEARAAAEIRSPHVVQVFDSGVTSDGALFMVMELLDGEGLDKRVRRQRLSLQELVDVVRQSCKGLAKAHQAGIVHRDIKPANVFLLDTGGDDIFVKLLDFGVAKFVEEEAVKLTIAGGMVGTPAFMSPEQLFDGGHIDHRGDLWSLAVVAYYALTGRRPYTGSSLGELCAAIRRGGYPAASSLRPDIPSEVDDWFERAFHADPAQRFASAKLFAQGLELAADTTSIMHSSPNSAAFPQTAVATFPGTSVPALPTTAAPPPRRRWVAWAAVAAVTSLTVVASIALMGRTPTAPPSNASAPAPQRGPGGAALPATAAERDGPSTDGAAASAPSPGAPVIRGGPRTAPLGAAPSPLRGDSHYRAGPPRSAVTSSAATSSTATSSAATSAAAASSAAAPTPPNNDSAVRDQRAERAAEELGI